MRGCFDLLLSFLLDKNCRRTENEMEFKIISTDRSVKLSKFHMLVVALSPSSHAHIHKSNLKTFSVYTGEIDFVLLVRPNRPANDTNRYKIFINNSNEKCE